jgi:hypothetical protein
VTDGLRPRTNLALLAALCGLEAGLLAVLLGWSRKNALPLAAFLETRTGIATAAAAVVTLASGIVIVRSWVRLHGAAGREFQLTLAMNLLTVALATGLIELAARVFTRRVLESDMLAGVALLPRSWERTVERYRDVITRAAGDLTYLVYDRDLGWSVGPGRASSNGLYFSSAEGVRGPAPDVRYRTETSRPRIVLVGDSHTFGEEVRFDDTWGRALERELDGAYQVINLGVPGYGTDQAYLRYERDAPAWRPSVVVFGVVAHDVERAMTVYSFLSFPDWNLPFSKPRLLPGDAGLRTLNVPALPPDSIFARQDVSQLPFLEYDRGYRTEEWRRRPVDVLYTGRLLRVWSQRYVPGHPYAKAEVTLALSEAILRAFMESARRANIRPLLVLFPGTYDLDSPESVSLAKQVLEQSHLPYVDLLPCLLTVVPSERFAPRGHYAPAANAAVGRCLAPTIRSALARRSP